MKFLFTLLGVLFSTAAIGQQVLSSNIVSPAAQAIQPSLCVGNGYPTPWEWLTPFPHANATNVTNINPKIEQWRVVNGVNTLVATYNRFGSNGPNCNYPGSGPWNQNPGPVAASGCGAFARSHAFNLMMDGDVFKVYASRYTGPGQFPYIGPVANTNSVNTTYYTPNNITVEGVVQNNIRPNVYINYNINNSVDDNTLGQGIVYIANVKNFKWSNINVIGDVGEVTDKSGMYVNGSFDTVISNTEISGFDNQAPEGSNGLFGTGNNTGYFKLVSVNFNHNGGNNGPSHDAYINASTIDPNYKLIAKNSWFHDVAYGHLFKCRAQYCYFYGNYFEGGAHQTGFQYGADSYGLDIPNPAVAVLWGNIFTKQYGASNALELSFGEEGMSNGGPFVRKASLDIRYNTFFTYNNTYDGSHTIIPAAFYPDLNNLVPEYPGQPGWPTSVTYNIQDNVYAGFCPTGNSAYDYRGTSSLTVSPNGEIGFDYSQLLNYVGTDNFIIGKEQYNHVAINPDFRRTSQVGAKD